MSEHKAEKNQESDMILQDIENVVHLHDRQSILLNKVYPPEDRFPEETNMPLWIIFFVVAISIGTSLVVTYILIYS